MSSNWVIQKIAKATCDLISNKIADRITKVSKNLQQNTSATVTNENNKEISKEVLKEKIISPKERQKNIENLDINIIV